MLTNTDNASAGEFGSARAVLFTLVFVVASAALTLLIKAMYTTSALGISDGSHLFRHPVIVAVAEIVGQLLCLGVWWIAQWWSADSQPPADSVADVDCCIICGAETGGGDPAVTEPMPDHWQPASLTVFILPAMVKTFSKLFLWTGLMYVESSSLHASVPCMCLPRASLARLRECFTDTANSVIPCLPVTGFCFIFFFFNN